MIPDKYKIVLFFLLIVPHTLYSKYNYTLKDTTLIHEYYNKAIQLDGTRPQYQDSIYYFLNKAMDISGELGYNKYDFRLYKQYSILLYQKENYSQALVYQYKAINELEKLSATEKDHLNVPEEYIKSQILLGAVYFNMKDTERALTYFEKALQEAEKLHRQEEDFDGYNMTTVIYNNMISVYIEKKDFVNARLIFEKAMSSIDSMKSDERSKDILRAAFYNNMGIVCRELKEYEKSFEYYFQTIDIYLKYDLRENLPQIYNNLANNYYEQGDLEKAISTFKESIELCRQYSNLKSEKIAISSLANIYQDKKDYYNSLLMTQKHLIITENLFKQENLKQINQIEDRYEYERIIEQERLVQQVRTAKREKRVLIYITTIVVLLLICLLLLFCYCNSKTQSQKQDLRRKNLELEKQNLELQNRELSKGIENKNKELTTQVMYLNQKNTFMTSIIQRLTELSKNIPPGSSANNLTDIIRQMKKNVDQTSWEEFEVRFQQVHQDFYKNLNDLAPNLTLNEKRLCAFLRLNMTTKEIAAITFQSVKSIQLARMRLRKKLQIEKDENLISLLQKL